MSIDDEIMREHLGGSAYAGGDPVVGVDLYPFLHRQIEWSRATFGPGERTEGLVDHIRSELVEILESGGELEEWVDVAILALDGAWRAGHSPLAICDALRAKAEKNRARRWPDWRTAEPGKAIEHIRDSAETPKAPQSRKFHMGLDVAGALRNRAFDGFRTDEGRPMSRDEAKAELESLLANGVARIPLGPCDAFDPKTGCPGHPMDESERQS